MININHFMAAIKLKCLSVLFTVDQSTAGSVSRLFYLNQYGKNLLIFNMNISTLNNYLWLNINCHFSTKIYCNTGSLSKFYTEKYSIVFGKLECKYFGEINL